jgi:hypothetical protein
MPWMISPSSRSVVTGSRELFGILGKEHPEVDPIAGIGRLDLK